MNHLKPWALIAAGLLVIDWLLGVLITSDALPLWTFLIANFPFGLPHVWFESHWAGTTYMIGGSPVNELWSFATFFSAVICQSVLYYALYRLIQSKKKMVLA